MRNATVQRHRGFSRLVLVLSSVVIALILSALPASAHNVLISSNPAAGSLLAHAPDSITLVFDQDVENVYAEMAITVGSLPPVEFTPQIDGAEVTADLAAEHLAIPAQQKGQNGPTAWRIGYRIVSADGHPVSGLVDFAVGTVGTTNRTATSLSTGSRQESRTGPPWPLIVGVALLLAIATGFVVIVLRRRRAASD